MQKTLTDCKLFTFITARNEVGARLCFYRRLWFCAWGGYLAGPPQPGPPRTRYTPQGPGTPPDQVYPPDQVHPPGGTRYTPQTWYTPRGQGTPPGTRHIPPDQVHPPTGPGTPPWIRYTPPGAQHAGRYGQCAGGTHPTGMQSCFC